MLPEDKARTILQKVRTIELRTRILMNDALSGAYHSIFKGQGINFEEVRERFLQKAYQVSQIHSNQ